MDWMPTFVAAAGKADIKQDLLDGYHSTALRRDPYEQATITSNSYHEWQLDRAFMLIPAQAHVGQFLASLKDYPPRMKAASVSLDKVMEEMTSAGAH
jgi:hypothetical protein